MEVNVKLENCGSPQTTSRESEITPEFEEPSLGQMARPQVSLVPSHLASPPMLWTSQDVRSWLEFCVKEFSLKPVCTDKFDLNGKALLLLTRTDFIERAPHAGDVLYNVFQRLLQQEGPAYLRSPIFLPAPAHFISPAAETLQRPLPAPSARPLYIPIRPQPQAPVCSSSSNATSPNSGNLIFSADEENSSVGPGVPASMLSPAPSEKCSSDAGSANNESGHSPHGSDHDMDYEESMNFDPGRELKYDTSDQNDDGVCRLLWEFIYQLLQDSKWSELVSWESVDDLTFRIQNPTNLADAWGKQKNRSNMTYEKLSRALRYYYKMNIIKKVQGKRLTYKFLQHPAKIRKGQRGARPHSSKGLAPRESDTEPTSTEGITPDSTFLPSCTISPQLSLNAVATATSQDYLRNISSPPRDYISDEPQENNTSGVYDAKENPILRACANITSTKQIQSSFILPDATSLSPCETINNRIRAHSVSPGKHLLAMQICQERFCTVNEKNEPTNHNAESRSQLARLNTSPEMHRRHWTFPRAETNSKNIPSVSLINEPYGGDCCEKILSPEEKLSFFGVSERKFSRQPSEQGFAQDKDRYLSRPRSPLCVPNSLSHLSPLQFTTTKSHDGALSFLYSGDSFNYHHPSSYSRSFNQTTAHSSYTHEQRRPTQISPELYRRPQQNHLTDDIFSNPSDLSVQGPQDPFQIKHTLKQESYDQEQDEPEDLSMKQSPGKDGLGQKVKSESDLPLVSRFKDVNRDSPRSCSADSAYSSDRAEFGKDASVDELHE